MLTARAFLFLIFGPHFCAPPSPFPLGPMGNSGQCPYGAGGGGARTRALDFLSLSSCANDEYDEYKLRIKKD